MTVDYSNLNNLIIPVEKLDDSSVIRRTDRELVVRLNDSLFIASCDSDADPAPYLEDRSLRTVLYPSTKNVSRILMLKDSPPKLKDIPADVREMERFYSDYSPWNADREYFSQLRKRGELTFSSYEDGELVSLAYTTKGCRQLCSLFTRPEYRGRGHAGRILDQCGPICLFVDDFNLIPFYNRHGFACVRTFNLIKRE